MTDVSFSTLIILTDSHSPLLMLKFISGVIQIRLTLPGRLKLYKKHRGKARRRCLRALVIQGEDYGHLIEFSWADFLLELPSSYSNFVFETCACGLHAGGSDNQNCALCPPRCLDSAPEDELFGLTNHSSPFSPTVASTSSSPLPSSPSTNPSIRYVAGSCPDHDTPKAPENNPHRILLPNGPVVAQTCPECGDRFRDDDQLE